MFDEQVDSELSRLFGPHPPDIPNVVAAGLFEPNVVRWGGGAGIGVVLLLSDWVRIRRAIRRNDALADRSIIVVTPRDILAFDAALLRVRKAPRELGRWRRADVVAHAVHATGPLPPAWIESGYTPPPVLRLETRKGVRLAEVKPVAWDEGVRNVLEELTDADPRSE